MSTFGPTPTPNDPYEPVEEWRPGTDRDGNEDVDDGSDGTRGGRTEGGAGSSGGKDEGDAGGVGGGD